MADKAKKPAQHKRQGHDRPAGGTATREAAGGSKPRPREPEARRGGKPEGRQGAKPEAKRGAPVRVVFLGGLGEIGRNCACLEVDGRILVIDCGIMFPDPDMPGVDLVLPDFSYLLEKTTLVPVRDGERRRIGPCDVEFIPVTHSVPHAFALAFHTPQGVVLHSGDFKLDLQPVDGRRTDLARFGALALDPGIRLLLSDSTNAEEPGFTPSESTVGETLRQLFAARVGRRVIVACFASHIHRVQQIVNAAAANGRRVAFLGRSMLNNVELARSLGLLTVDDDVLVDVDDIGKLDGGRVCVISTGSQGEPMSALSLMAIGENKRVQIEPDDVVMISAHPIPGNEWSVGRVIDQLHRRGAEVIHSSKAPVHVSGHARQGELRTLLAITRPDAFVPVHGEYRHMVHHAQLAVSMGVPADQVVLCEDGDVVALDESGLRRDGSVPAGYLYVDGTVGDVSHGVLRDRRMLADEGVVMVVANVDLHAAQVVGTPRVITRGWVHATEAEDLLEESATVVAEALAKAMADGARDVEVLSRAVRRSLGALVSERTRRRPLIIPVVLVV